MCQQVNIRIPIILNMDNHDPCILEASYNTWDEFAGEIKPQTNKLILLNVNLRSLLKIMHNSPVIIHLIIITEANVTNSTKCLFD